MTTTTTMMMMMMMIIQVRGGSCEKQRENKLIEDRTTSSFLLFPFVSAAIDYLIG